MTIEVVPHIQGKSESLAEILFLKRPQSSDSLKGSCDQELMNSFISIEK